MIIGLGHKTLTEKSCLHVMLREHMITSDGVMLLNHKSDYEYVIYIIHSLHQTGHICVEWSKVGNKLDARLPLIMCGKDEERGIRLIHTLVVLGH